MEGSTWVTNPMVLPCGIPIGEMGSERRIELERRTESERKSREGKRMGRLCRTRYREWGRAWLGTTTTIPAESPYETPTRGKGGGRGEEGGTYGTAIIKPVSGVGDRIVEEALLSFINLTSLVTVLEGH